jgi:hypothetical protein
MTLIEQLQQLDATLRTLIPTGNEQALESVVEDVEAFRPAYISPQVSPRAILAGKLSEVEQGCKILRERLGVEFTVASGVTVHVQAIDPATGQAINKSSTTGTDDSPLE